MTALIITGCTLSYIILGVINTKLMYKYRVWDMSWTLRRDNGAIAFCIVFWPLTFFFGTLWLLLAAPIMPLFRWTRSWIVK